MRSILQTLAVIPPYCPCKQGTTTPSATVSHSHYNDIVAEPRDLSFVAGQSPAVNRLPPALAGWEDVVANTRATINDEDQVTVVSDTPLRRRKFVAVARLHWGGVCGANTRGATLGGGPHHACCRFVRGGRLLVFASSRFGGASSANKARCPSKVRHVSRSQALQKSALVLLP